MPFSELTNNHKCDLCGLLKTENNEACPQHRMWVAEAEVERLREEIARRQEVYQYGEADMDLKDDEIAKLREAAKLLSDEARERLRKERDHRIYWQGIACSGMNLVDSVFGKKMYGEGTTEERISECYKNATVEIKRLKDEIGQLRKNCEWQSQQLKTLIGAGWAEDQKDEIKQLRADLAEARAVVRAYWTLHDRFSMSPEELAEHLTRHPWLEDE